MEPTSLTRKPTNHNPTPSSDKLQMDAKGRYEARLMQVSARSVVVLTLFLWYSICAAQTASPTSPAMEVVFLGTGGPRPAGRAAPCNLILIHGKARLLVDAGSGAFHPGRRARYRST